MRRIIVILLLISIFTKTQAQFKVVAYLPKYTSTLEDHINAFDFTKVTHINIAFFNPDANGDFPASQGNGLSAIVSKAHLNNVKVLLSIGGGSLRPNYTDLLKNENRAAFVNKVVALLPLYNADGIDIDLEGDNIDENYGAFITDLSAQLKPSGKLLTAAVAWWTRNRISDAALEAFDFINIMAYDKAGAEHSPYSYATQHINYWKGDRGLPASKIVVGVPFYGWYTKDGSLKEMSYKQVLAGYPGSQNKDSIIRTDDYVLNYNGIPTIQNKTAFSQGVGGGIMFWQVLQDSLGNHSLLKAIHDKMDINTDWKDPFITWRYDMNTGTGNLGNVLNGTTTDVASISTKGSPGFLPYPAYGYGKVFLPANSGAAFELQNTSGTTKLKVKAAQTGAPGKLSWYNIGEATAVTALTFNLKLDAALTNGQIIIPFGNGANNSNTFNNSSQLTSVNTTGVFGAVRLDFYGGSFATLSYRNSTYGYTSINNNVFNKTGDYKIELYCNNDSINRQYIKSNTMYTLPAQKFNMWVNGVLMQAASLSDFPATGELAAYAVINSFSFNTSGNTGTSTPPTAANSLIATLDSISMKFAFKPVPPLIATSSAPLISSKLTQKPEFIKVSIVNNSVAEISVFADKMEEAIVLLSDMQGKKIAQLPAHLTKGDNKLKFDMSKLAPGIYIVTAYKSGKTDSVKFVK